MTSRYYDDKEAEIVPGKISQELRAALNLADNDVPVWIYRMRALGYPPGWLNKAIVDTSDIFDTDVPKKEEQSGKRKNPPNNDVQYDHSKLIEFPGFNTPLPPDANDYHYYHNMPPMLPHQQLDYAKKTMSAFKPAPLPAKRFRTASPSSDNNHNESGSSADNKNSSNNNDPETPASPDPESNEDEDSSNGSSSANDLDKTSGSAISATSKTTNLSTNSITGEIKLLSRGSLMPQPVKRLPLERFSEGVVGDLLYFENIPNSTGKFESIRGLLNGMRRSKSDADKSTSSDHNTSSTSFKSDNQ